MRDHDADRRVLLRRWEEVDAVFTEVLTLPKGRRDVFLAERCGGDRELLDTVERLLEAADQEGEFLEGPPTLGPFQDPDPDDPTAGSRTGFRVGAFELREVLGRGGMATVYLAERADGQFEQRVAVKLLRHGLDTEDVVRRFVAERQILSSLSHPNISRLLDGGATEDGLPYLVMEHVEGIPITRYCDERRLPLAARLGLFCDVAGAVQHAHRSLVVHRDIKPSNVLVDTDGRVKLLDFGIAKLLTGEDAEATRTGLRPLTPSHASPEQVRGERITTASDVYQLGLLLCELLAGRLPYEVAALSPVRAERAITRSEPARPSALVTEAAAAGRATTEKELVRRLRGDLDLIVLTALRKEPERRYASVDALLADVESYRSGRPISARPDTAGYRARKFLGRHRWVAPTAALVTLLVAVWMVTLQRQRDIARDEAQRAREVQRLLVDLFRSPDPLAPNAGPGRDVTVRDALSMGAQRLRSELQELPALRAELLGTVSQVLGNLGSLEEAQALTEEALATEREIYGERSLQAAASMGRLGNLLIDRGQRDSAHVVLRSQVELTTALAGPRDPRLGEALFNLGRVYTSRQEFALAREEFERAAGILRAAAPPREEELVKVLQALSQSYILAYEHERSVRSAEEAVELAERFWGPDHPATARARAFLAHALRFAGEAAEAEREFRRSMRTLEEHLGPAHPYTLTVQTAMAEFLGTEGHMEEAAELYGRALEGRIALHGEESLSAAGARAQTARVLTRIGRLAEAESLYLNAIATYRASDEDAAVGLMNTLLSLTELYLEWGRFDEAEPTAAETLEIARALFEPPDLRIAQGECLLGLALTGAGRTGEARGFLEQGVAGFQATFTRPSRLRDQCVQALEALRPG